MNLPEPIGCPSRHGIWWVRGSVKKGISLLYNVHGFVPQPAFYEPKSRPVSHRSHRAAETVRLAGVNRSPVPGRSGSGVQDIGFRWKQPGKVRVCLLHGHLRRAQVPIVHWRGKYGYPPERRACPTRTARQLPQFWVHPVEIHQPGVCIGGIQSPQEIQIQRRAPL